VPRRLTKEKTGTDGTVGRDKNRVDRSSLRAGGVSGRKTKERTHSSFRPAREGGGSKGGGDLTGKGWQDNSDNKIGENTRLRERLHGGLAKGETIGHDHDKLKEELTRNRQG